MKRTVVLAVCAGLVIGGLCADACGGTADNQLTHLDDTEGNRFVLREITWPQRVGEAEICLWKCDKYAAVSLTIDDNCKPDHEWWLRQCEQFGFKVTWFVITKGINVSNVGFVGTWADYQRLVEAGHAVQSHTVNHHSDDDQRSDAEVRTEYGDSKKVIESSIPGTRCVTLAYPWGKGKPELAADYYIAARGTVGTPNMANRTRYMNTSAGHLNNDMINSILGRPVEKIAWLGNPRYRRGWITPVYHLVASGRTDDERQAHVAREREHLEYVARFSDRLWIDTFVNVAKYGQERDSATMAVTEVTGSRIILEVKDMMHDGLFDYPLTVKVCIPDGWRAVTARQGGEEVEAQLVEHADRRYALVSIVPDRGPVTLGLR